MKYGGGDTAGRVNSSDTRDLRFESSNWEIFIEKTKYIKEPEKVPFKKAYDIKRIIGLVELVHQVLQQTN